MTVYIKYEPNDKLVTEAQKLLQCPHINTVQEKAKYHQDLEEIMQKILQHNCLSAVKQLNAKVFSQTGMNDFSYAIGKSFSMNSQIKWLIENIEICEEANEELHHVMLELSYRIQEIWKERNNHENK